MVISFSLWVTWSKTARFSALRKADSGIAGASPAARGRRAYAAEEAVGTARSQQVREQLAVQGHQVAHLVSNWVLDFAPRLSDGPGREWTTVSDHRRARHREQREASGR